ncbi:hypothetical protein CMETHOX_39150 [Lacrimispora indolis]|nr:hypothetical protein CMETHOX_39150 [[Clostridium] methoxybenzovorans]
MAICYYQLSKCQSNGAGDCSDGYECGNGWIYRVKHYQNGKKLFHVTMRDQYKIDGEEIRDDQQVCFYLWWRYEGGCRRCQQFIGFLYGSKVWNSNL